jgi:hypothetical protein
MNEEHVRTVTGGPGSEVASRVPAGSPDAGSPAWPGPAGSPEDLASRFAALGIDVPALTWHGDLASECGSYARGSPKARRNAAEVAGEAGAVREGTSGCGGWGTGSMAGRTWGSGCVLAGSGRWRATGLGGRAGAGPRRGTWWDGA